MDLRKIIHELEVEKQRLDEAILALERLSAGNEGRKVTVHKSFDGAGEAHPLEAHSDPPTTAAMAHSAQK